jgi:hypothetical protein
MRKYPEYNVLDKVHAKIYLEMTQRLMSIDELKGMERALEIIKEEMDKHRPEKDAGLVP